MVLRVAQVERQRLLGDRADKALPDAQRGMVHGFALQALGGVQFEHAIRPQHVGRAHLGHHVGGDLRNNFVEAGLVR